MSRGPNPARAPSKALSLLARHGNMEWLLRVDAVRCEALQLAVGGCERLRVSAISYSPDWPSRGAYVQQIGNGALLWSVVVPESAKGPLAKGDHHHQTKSSQVKY
jgi:hypothetical protein